MGTNFHQSTPKFGEKPPEVHLKKLPQKRANSISMSMVLEWDVQAQMGVKVRCPHTFYKCVQWICRYSPVFAHVLDTFSYCSSPAQKWTQQEKAREAVMWVNHMTAAILDCMDGETTTIHHVHIPPVGSIAPSRKFTFFVTSHSSL